eukprot:scaffold20740_cov89-Phaeocystis_antarctica.AAC.5
MACGSRAGPSVFWTVGAGGAERSRREAFGGTTRRSLTATVSRTLYRRTVRGENPFAQPPYV